MDASFFHHPGFIFGVAAGVSWLAKRLRLPDVLFLLLAGVIFGVGGLVC
jgi:Kef-type K+ transport system membrane component KefB